jgi:2C-methyl-D-erythritol 2,4-cyclodiphosphate synthase
MTDLSALPTVSPSSLPADVRAGTPQDQRAYRAALGFERILLGELVQDMTKAGGLSDSPRASAIEDAMSDALLGAGGLGLGRQLFDAMRPPSKEAAA